MAVGETITYARDFFRLDYPVEWSTRENHLVGLTDFCHPGANAGLYPSGIALMTIPETGMALEQILRAGLFFITRDLHSPSIERLGEERDGGLTWHRLLVRGRTCAPSHHAPHLAITKYVALCRPGPGVLVLALYGPTEKIEPLRGDFEALRRSVRIVR